MTYKRGDYVFPGDLPRRFLCMVSDTETLRLGNSDGQILKLSPLEGPWPQGTFLIRLDHGVRPALRGRTRSMRMHAALMNRMRGGGESGPASHGEAA
jgi:hypothetical protein